MHASPHNYFPVSPLFVTLLLLGLGILVALVELNILTYAYEKMGISRRYVFSILLLSLVGSGINVPVAEIPAQDVRQDRIVSYFGVQYVIPEMEHHDRTILAVNVGGCVIPVVLSIYLVVNNPIFARAAIAVVIISVATHLMARPVPGVGIAMPIFIPPVLAALTAVLLDRRHAAPVAYVAGSIGTLLGADIFNLYRLQELGAPVASIGGAGTSDGIFMVGIIAVLLA